MRTALVAIAIALLTAGGVGSAATAQADPALCHDQRLCRDLSKVYYCPGTGAVVGPFASCPSLVTGPYAPGGLRPNTGLSPLN